MSRRACLCQRRRSRGACRTLACPPTLSGVNCKRDRVAVDSPVSWRCRGLRREDKQGLMMELHPDKLTDNAERIFNGGDIFIARTATLLELRWLCDKVSEDYKFNFKLSDYLLRMVCSRILHPGSKLSDFINGRRFIENKDLMLGKVLYYQYLSIIYSIVFFRGIDNLR